MHHSNGYTSLLQSLTLPELERLQKLIAWSAPEATTDDIDWDAVVDEIRNPSPLSPEPTIAPNTLEERAKWRRKIDGGRRYELSLFCPDIDPGNMPGLRGKELDARYEEEWQHAQSLHASGMTHKDAWVKIREDCRLRSTSLDLAKIDALLDEEFDDEPIQPKRKLLRQWRRKH